MPGASSRNQDDTSRPAPCQLGQSDRQRRRGACDPIYSRRHAVSLAAAPAPCRGGGTYECHPAV
eukprot:3495393-Heterocapsa_arctica.AAC.1